MTLYDLHSMRRHRHKSLMDSGWADRWGGHKDLDLYKRERPYRHGWNMADEVLREQARKVGQPVEGMTQDERDEVIVLAILGLVALGVLYFGWHLYRSIW